ncbi:MAG: pyridoxamine 5'-phosphate oxidase family protein [Deltaproteobacteria bacterium]|nr:pyridoxamine 5'-phosphate oxidase family protein [Deltaproteobacteria bacterium]
MEISQQHWDKTRKLFGDGTHATASPALPYCAFATVDEDGSPRAAPYTSLILNDKMRGFYFDEFSRNTSVNLDRDQKVCVLIVKSSRLFWFKTLVLGRFDHPPGIRLMGRVAEKREATEQELNAFKKPLRSLRFFKGYKPIWGFMKHGREIDFHSFELVKCGSIKELESI